MPTREPGSGASPGQPEHIGDYRILDVLGEGAMGTVYLAEQREPVRRRVALKVVKRGMDSRQVLARFELERQALAVMNHEAIAKVFDAGTTELGQPFFVMELVEGTPIARYCDEHRLSLSARIALFRQVCSGVQHAHQKGVLHRDLKPGNVLVARKGDQHIPKIIDFGVARATDHQLVADTIYTEQGVIIGTPEYMSPEQAGGTALDIDTRTDIYSLGVVLYELLTGDLPFSPTELRNAGVLGMQQIIRERDPAKPSARVSGSGELAADRSALRSTTVTDLIRALSGDLDWVVLTAMAKEPERRYASAAALSDDLGNFLDGRPVVARPPSAAYTLARFVRRHRVEVAAGLVVFAVSAVGFAVSAMFAVRASESADAYANLLVGAELDALEYRAARAYPSWPANGSELDALVEAAEKLLDTVPVQEAVLARLREDGERASAAERPLSRGPHFEEARVASLEAEVAFLTGQLPDPRLSDSGRAAGEREVAALREQLAEAQATIDRSNRVAIPGAKEQFLHDRLEQQLGRLRRVERELLPELRFRAAAARNVRSETVERARDAWVAAIDGIRHGERYAGLEIEPQLGLVPLGADPESGLWEFAHPLSGAVPRRLDDSHELELGPDHGIVFVLIPPGRLRFGEHDGLPPERRESLPEETVDAFFLAKFEASRAQWQRLARGQRGLRLHDAGIMDLRNRYDEPHKPANAVTCTMCEELLGQCGLDLPSELQWEYACKAGTTTLWYSGNDVETLVGHANLQDLTYASSRGGSDVAPIEDGFAGLAPAIALGANGFGLHQMHGNVLEWCADVHRGANTKRAIRGGSFMRNHARALTTYRDVTVPTDTSRDVGLRPARRIHRGLVTNWR